MKKSIPGSAQKRLSKPTVPNENISDMFHKLQKSSILDGGFDILLHKIDNIEQSQGQLVAKVDKIHDAIYDVDTGLFSKLTEHKIESLERLNTLSQNITSLSEWKKHRENEETKNDSEIESATNKIVVIEKTIEHLERYKNTAWSIIKWISAAAAGGGLTFLFKWLEVSFKF